MTSKIRAQQRGRGREGGRKGGKEGGKGREGGREGEKERGSTLIKWNIKIKEKFIKKIKITRTIHSSFFR